MHDITTLNQTPQSTTAYTGWLRVGFRTCIEGKHPKTRKQTHKTYTQVQSTHDKMCQHEQQHGIHIIVGQGGQWIPMMGIYGQKRVVVPKGMMGHSNEACGGRRWSLWVEIRSYCVGKVH